MAATFNRYNPAGWADGFNATRDAIQGYQQDQALANIEQNGPPGQPPNVVGQRIAAGQSPIGLGDLNGQGDMSAQGQPMGAGSPIGDAASTGMPINYSQMPQSIDPGLAMAQARASAMRQYGNPDGANKELQAYSNLGLSNAQTEADKARTAGQTIKNTGDQAKLTQNAALNQIDQQVGQQLQDKGIDPTTPDGALAAGKLRVDALTKAGHWDAAQAASANMVKTQGDVLNAQTNDRASAANNIVLAAKGGKLTPALVSQFHDQYVPDGTTTKSVVMNGDGGFTLTTQDPAGNTSTQTVKGADVPNLYATLGSPSAAATIVGQLAQAAKDKLTAAQTNSANASAGHSAASAANVRQQTAQSATLNARDNSVWNARVHQNMDGPPTEADNALVGAADDAAVSKRARIDPNGTQDIRALTQQRVGVESQMRMIQGQMANLSPKDPRMATLQTQLDAATAQHDAVLRSLGGLSGSGAPPSVAQPGAPGASPPAAAAATIPDQTQRRVGQVYTNAAGVKAVWTGQGWQPQ